VTDDFNVSENGDKSILPPSAGSQSKGRATREIPEVSYLEVLTLSGLPGYDMIVTKNSPENS